MRSRLHRTGTVACTCSLLLARRSVGPLRRHPVSAGGPADPLMAASKRRMLYSLRNIVRVWRWGGAPK